MMGTLPMKTLFSFSSRISSAPSGSVTVIVLVMSTYSGAE